MQVARNFFLSAREDPHAQAVRSAAGLQDRAQPVQGPDPRALHEPDLSGPARLRLRRRRADLLRQGAATSTWPRQRCWPACRKRRRSTTRSSIRSAPSSASNTSCGACTSWATSPTAPIRSRPQERPCCRIKREATDIRRARRIRGRDGAPDGRTSSIQEDIYTRGLTRLHHHHQGRPGCGLHGAAPRRDGLRPAPRLSRPGRLSSSCRRSGRGSDSRRRWPTIRTATTCSPRSCCRADAKPVEARVLRSGEKITISGDGPAVRRALADRQGGAADQRIRRGAIIRVTQDGKALEHHAAAGSRIGASSRSTRRTARSARWSAASTSAATSSTT